MCFWPAGENFLRIGENVETQTFLLWLKKSDWLFNAIRWVFCHVMSILQQIMEINFSHWTNLDVMFFFYSV